MGATKATRAEIQAQIDALSQQLESADDDVELWVEKDGVKTKLTGGHARGWLKKLGLADGEGEGEGEGEGDGDGDGDEQDGKPPADHRYFRRK